MQKLLLRKLLRVCRGEHCTLFHLHLGYNGFIKMQKGKKAVPKLTSQNQQQSKSGRVFHIILNVLLFAAICVLLVFCVLYRDKITADEIVRLTPENQLAAAILMLMLFAVKSFCVFIYCGILYAASGMIFSLPLAFAVNVLGTVVMSSIPYFIGKKSGSHYVEKLVEKHPNMTLLHEAQGENNFVISLIIRLAGVLPGDLVSAFFGASAMPYGKYMLSTVLGFLPMVASFTVMGMSVHDVTSPAFLLAVGGEVVLLIGSVIFYVFYRKKLKKNKK